GASTLTPLAPITLQEMKLDPSMAAYQQESSTYNGVNTSTDAAAAAGSSPGLPLSLPADPAPPAAPQGGNSSPDPGSLTVLQPANNNVATAAASPYSTMLPGFAHYSTGNAVGGGVVPVSDYSYSSPYSQYTTSYGTYGYGAGGLLNSTYYYGNGVSSCSTLNQNLFQRASCALDGDTGVEARSPMAATRANSGASAASPIGMEPMLLFQNNSYPNIQGINTYTELQIGTKSVRCELQVHEAETTSTDTRRNGFECGTRLE
ncbi:hypothetical protein Cfor_10070, partial [Coptotermes formosanus]